MMQTFASICFLLGLLMLIVALGWYGQGRRFACDRTRQAALAMAIIGLLFLFGSAALAAGW